MMMFQAKEGRSPDPFWDDASQLLLEAVIAYLVEGVNRNERNLHTLLKFIAQCQICEGDSEEKTVLDIIFDDLKKKNKDSFAVSQYEKFRIAASRTLKSILISVNAKIGSFDTPEINKMTETDDIHISSIGRKKTALFVVVSDTDRSLDGLANIFFTQAMNELCWVADKCCESNTLPVPVRFILDDFATNCCIDEFPRMIASIRSRGISTMLMIQAESQLTHCYGYEGKTIIGNCDTYVYLGGNDIDTATAVSKRCDVPLKKVLNMPVGTNWIFRRGQEPVNGVNFKLEPYLESLRFKENPVSDLSRAAR